MTAVAKMQRLRFSFEVLELFHAARLTADLREVTGCRLRVRPLSRPPRRRQLWSVVLETTPAPADRLDVARWEVLMQAAAGRHPGCRLVGWQSLDRTPE